MNSGDWFLVQWISGIWDLEYLSSLYQKKFPDQELNPRPLVSKSYALPTELLKALNILIEKLLSIYLKSNVHMHAKLRILKVFLGVSTKVF